MRRCELPSTFAMSIRNPPAGIGRDADSMLGGYTRAKVLDDEPASLRA